jgi:hypothetical protein
MRRRSGADSPPRLGQTPNDSVRPSPLRDSRRLPTPSYSAPHQILELRPDAVPEPRLRWPGHLSNSADRAARQLAAPQPEHDPPGTPSGRSDEDGADGPSRRRRKAQPNAMRSEQASSSSIPAAFLATTASRRTATARPGHPSRKTVRARSPPDGPDEPTGRPVDAPPFTRRLLRGPTDGPTAVRSASNCSSQLRRGCRAARKPGPNEDPGRGPTTGPPDRPTRDPCPSRGPIHPPRRAGSVCASPARAAGHPGRRGTVSARRRSPNRPGPRRTDPTRDASRVREGAAPARAREAFQPPPRDRAA